MKILIAPSLLNPTYSTESFIAEKLAEVFVQNGIETVIAACDNLRVPGVSFYPTSVRTKKYYPCSTVEETLFASGIISAKNLEQDYEALHQIIEESHPDCIFELTRPTAIAAAKDHNIPVISVVRSSLFRNISFPQNALTDLNALLAAHGMVQLLRYYDIYENAQKLVVFSPLDLEPLPVNVQALRIGYMHPFVPDNLWNNRLSIYLGSTMIRPWKLRSIMKNAFRGAGYDVFIYHNHSHTTLDGNLHYIDSPRLSSIQGSYALIHDGNTALTNFALNCGIPQIILTDGSYESKWNANAVLRTGIGLTFDQSQLTFEKLYETYRELVSDDIFADNTTALKQKCDALYDITSITELL